MADDKSKQDNRDRSKVSSSDDYEVEYLMTKYDLSRNRAFDLIAKHGRSVSTAAYDYKPISQDSWVRASSCKARLRTVAWPRRSTPLHDCDCLRALTRLKRCIRSRVAASRGYVPDGDAFLTALAARLVADGIPLAGGALTQAAPHPVIERRTWLWRADTGRVIEALNLAIPADREHAHVAVNWLASIGTGVVQEDFAGGASDGAVLAWTGSRPFSGS